MLQCVAVCCRVLQSEVHTVSVLSRQETCMGVCYSVLQCVAVCRSVVKCVAVCCSVLQCVAVWCSMLQCVAVHSTNSIST